MLKSTVSEEGRICRDFPQSKSPQWTEDAWASLEMDQTQQQSQMFSRDNLTATSWEALTQRYIPRPCLGIWTIETTIIIVCVKSAKFQSSFSKCIDNQYIMPPGECRILPLPSPGITIGCAYIKIEIINWDHALFSETIPKLQGRSSWCHRFFTG